MAETLEIPTSLEELESLYAKLEATGLTWNKETWRLEKELLQGVKDRMAARERERLAFVTHKGRVFHALQAARKAAAELADAQHTADLAAEAEKVADEGLSEPQGEPNGDAGDGGTPSTAGTTEDSEPVTAGMYASVSSKVIAELIELNKDAVTKLDGFKNPNSRKEAIDLLVRAGVTPPKKAK